MARYHVEVIEPSPLIADSSSPREALEAVWRKLGAEPRPWHWSSRVDSGGGLFLKGLEVGFVLNPQHFLRRWHIRNEFRNLVALGHLAVEKPLPLAWGCESWLGFPVRSFLIERDVGGVDFSEFIRRESDAEKRVAVFREVGSVVHRLHSEGWIHGDLACRNLMVRPDTLEVVLVDLARVRPTSPHRIGWRRRKDLYRLVKSADKCGATAPEVEAMLEAAAGDQARNVIEATRSLRAIGSRLLRKLLTWQWRITGRTFGSQRGPSRNR